MKKNKTLLTVIVPCYNVEKYVERCIDSILNQSFKNMEIILIDDCSTDNTFNILKKYDKDHENVKAFKNNSNLGAGYSRNFALSKSNGEYISFIDSDDYIFNDYFNEMINTLKRENSDIVVCDIFIRYADSGLDVRSIACEGKTSAKNIINNGLSASPCNKIFKKSLIEKYPFPEGIMNEDVATVLACLANAKKISYNENVFYNYFQHNLSVQNSNLSDKRFDIFKSLEVLQPRIAGIKRFNDYWDIIVFQQIIMLFFYVIPKEKNNTLRSDFLKKFNNYAKDYNLRGNKYYWQFIDSQGIKHKLYYKLLLKMNCLGASWFSSDMIAFYNWYKSKNDKSVINHNIGVDDLIFEAKKQSKLPNSKYSISVVIPNYNYEKFMFERLYSILYQKIKINEIIILDDCSTDNSREMIDNIQKKLSKYINIIKVYNDVNSGSAFKQWKKGFSLAKSNYIWIAEADDYCDADFLKNVIKPFKSRKNVVISYSDTAFIDKNGKIILKSIKPEIDVLRSKHWNKSYINKGLDEIHEYGYLNCTIANVSSVLFKRDNYEDFFEISGNFKQAGDWVFYVNVMSKGYVAYSDKILNYYRVHGNNVTSTTKKQAHFDEIKRVHKFYSEKYNLNRDQLKKIKGRYSFLRKVWKVK